jgi:hypothetical protein
MIFVVTEISTGKEVYRYTSDAAIEWKDMEFATHTHLPVVETVDVVQPAVTERKISKLEYVELFTDNEMVSIFAAAKVSPLVEIWLEKFRLSEFIDLADPRNTEGLYALESAGILGQGRAAEILNGN